jgi:hypothetical protein
MSTSVNKKLAIIASCLLIVSGCKNGLPERSFGDQYLNLLKKDLDETSVIWNIHPASKLVYNANYLLSLKNCNQLVVVDRANLNLIVAGNNGDELYRTGGEGQGPGEFQSILSPFIDYDNRLYVIDGISKRITVYEIGNEELSLVSSITYKEPPQYFLHSVYVTKHGNFGVYQQSEGFFTPENKFLLYRLDENFAPIDQLVEMPGNERYESVRTAYTLYTPHKYLSRTIWGLDNSWFYYITTMSPTIFKYNLQSEKRKEITFLEMDERLNSPEFLRLAKDYYPVEDDKEYWDVLDDIEKLPLFSQIIGGVGRKFLTVTSTPGYEGMGIIINKDSEHIQYFRTPQEFNPTSVCGDTIYGVDLQVEGEYKIMSIKLIED